MCLIIRRSSSSFVVVFVIAWFASSSFSRRRCPTATYEHTYIYSIFWRILTYFNVFYLSIRVCSNFGPNPSHNHRRLKKYSVIRTLRRVKWRHYMWIRLSISSSHVVRQVYMYCNRKINRLQIAKRWLTAIYWYILTNLSHQTSASVPTRFRELSGRTIQLPYKMASTAWP